MLKKLVLLLLISLFSCQKSLDHRINLFTTTYDNSIKEIVNGNPFITSTSAEKTAEKEITIRFYCKTSESEFNNDLVIKSIPPSFALAIRQDREVMNLLNDGVNFRVRILDEKGQKLLYSQDINQKTE